MESKTKKVIPPAVDAHVDVSNIPSTSAAANRFVPAANSGPCDNQVSGIGMIKGAVHQAEPVGLAALTAAVNLAPASDLGLYRISTDNVVSRSHKLV